MDAMLFANLFEPRYQGTFASERPQFRSWGHQTCFLPRAPPNLVTLLVISNSNFSNNLLVSSLSNMF